MDGDSERREGKITIKWSATGIGSVSLDGVVFARVEWSERRQKFCIEDAAGQCLRHVASIHGAAAAKDEAVALAIAMVRDGRMPDPKTAQAEHREREKLREERLRAAREKRRQQPAEIRKREAEAERLRRYGDAVTKEWRAKKEEDAAPPLYEALADAFNFADPELWKSNSFAALRPRLVLHVRHVIARLEYELASESGRSPKPFLFSATTEERQAAAERRKAETSAAIAKIEAALAKAREILVQLEAP